MLIWVFPKMGVPHFAPKTSPFLRIPKKSLVGAQADEQKAHGYKFQALLSQTLNPKPNIAIPTSFRCFSSCCSLCTASVGFHVVVSQNIRGPQYKPQNTIVLIIRAPKILQPQMVPLNLGTPHVGFGRGYVRNARKPLRVEGTSVKPRREFKGWRGFKGLGFRVRARV